MKKDFRESTPPKMAETAQILTQILRKGFTLPFGGLKSIKDGFSRPLPETRIIRAFKKLAFETLKEGLKGVLSTFKEGLNKIAIFAKKQQKSQPPIFRFLEKKEEIWQS